MLVRIENYLKASGTPPARFGREAVGDPRLVFDLRNGRDPKRRLRTRLAAYLEREEALLERRPCAR